ncbi:hypothetical protein OH76DRAFT_1018677 [Lentinus brumalis]|uniref:F-box domain-containing protein n=1 Tax=Lentinus brumalis TaxID=2498619 RepID=A0A371CY53_9APHY|nr:hypothetical protein OH76DRAFT_1018677 [Polyporus brumalis]
MKGGHSATHNMPESSSSLPHAPAHLPREILLMLLESLDGDKEALRSCSLVCRAWLSISRSQLFRAIYFRPPHTGWTDCFVRFLYFFLTSQRSGSDLGRHVEDLTFHGGCRRVPYLLDKYNDLDDSGSRDRSEDGYVSCQLHVLVRLGSVFPRLKRLALVDLSIESRTQGHAHDGGVDHTIAVLPEDRSPLGELHIHQIHSHMDNYSDIFQVICSFPEIGKLSLGFTWQPERLRIFRSSEAASRFVDETPNRCPVIRNLELGNTDQFLVSICHALMRRSGGFEGSLHSLRCRRGWMGIETFRPLLADARVHLRELNLDLFEDDYRDWGST